MVFYGLLLASVMGSGSPDTDCTMQPPPLDIATMHATRDVKSLVVDPSKLSANMLLKDGSSVRVVNMGCQHSGSVARAWVMNPPSLSDSAAWIKEANKVARIAFTPPQAKSFAEWIKNRELEKTDDQLAQEGTDQTEITYSIEVEPASMAMGSWLTISYSYP